MDVDLEKVAPWRGDGWLVPVIVTVIQPIAFSFFGTDRAGGASSMITWLLASIVVIVTLGVYLNDRPGRVSEDSATGRRIVLRRRHALLRIPMQWWAVPLVLAGPYLVIGVSAC